MAIVSPKQFCLRVEENFAYEGLNMVESVLEACEYFKVDIESVKEFINNSITERLAFEAHKRNLYTITGGAGNIDQFMGE